MTIMVKSQLEFRFIEGVKLNILSEMNKFTLPVLELYLNFIWLDKTGNSKKLFFMIRSLSIRIIY